MKVKSIKSRNLKNVGISPNVRMPGLTPTTSLSCLARCFLAKEDLDVFKISDPKIY